MVSLNNLLDKRVPKKLHEFVTSCESVEDLVKKLENNSSLIFAILQNMNMQVEGNKPFAARLLYRISLQDIENPEVKRVEVLLRNKGLLQRETDPDFSLIRSGGSLLNAHKSILALESPYFKALGKFSEFQKGMISLDTTGFDPKVCQFVLDYLYLPDEKRKEFASTVDKIFLPAIAGLSDYWEIQQLKSDCDDELCHSLAELNIKKSELKDWLNQSPFLPKFTMLLQFIYRIANKGDLVSVIERMQTPAGAQELAAQCTPKEKTAFATMKTEFGKVCQIPEGTFGKIEWEKTFPVTIKPEWVPPLPANIHKILELKDPCELGKKLKESCTLFLRPEKVILHENGCNKELQLGFDEVEELALKTTNPERRMAYDTYSLIRDKMNQIPVEKSRWVLMRKEVIAGSRNLCFESQKQLLKGLFEVPKTIDALLLNLITYVSEGKYLYGVNPLTFTRCQEGLGVYQILVGGLSHSGLHVSFGKRNSSQFGLSGSWKL